MRRGLKALDAHMGVRESHIGQQVNKPRFRGLWIWTARDGPIDRDDFHVTPTFDRLKSPTKPKRRIRRPVRRRLERVRPNLNENKDPQVELERLGAKPAIPKFSALIVSKLPRDEYLAVPSHYARCTPFWTCPVRRLENLDFHILILICNFYR